MLPGVPRPRSPAAQASTQQPPESTPRPAPGLTMQNVGTVGGQQQQQPVGPPVTIAPQGMDLMQQAAAEAAALGAGSNAA